MSLRRSTISPAEPAGSARRKNGSAEAVCVSATYIGPAPSDTINHAAPTLCMKVPISEMTSATSRLRKTAVCSGRHKLGEPGCTVSEVLMRLSDRFIRRQKLLSQLRPGVTILKYVVCQRESLNQRESLDQREN